MKLNIRTFLTRWLAVVAAGLLSAALGVAHAQPTDPAADPPSRVARLSDLSGQVWLYNTDSGEWVTAVRNRPVTAGDRLATDAGARAELQLGSTTVRIDSGSELEVVDLDDERLSLQLYSGSAIARVLDLNNGGLFDLTTDEGRFVVQRAGTYRFDRDGTASRVSVYGGQARYEGPNSALPISAGQRAEFWIDSGGVAQYTLAAPVSDAFYAWSNERDRRAVAPVTARYVSPEMTGAEELDRYGRWEQSPEYGALWVPTAVAVDWAPYRNGHWAWVRPWGWTWVDDAPWGFAPFHYGRWVYVRNNWCWTPGARVARPVYAPALVAWIGGSRGNVSVSVGGGPVGWFPLAPREVYVPSYRVSPRYAQNINITHVTNVTVINNVFANPQQHRDFGNQRYQNAITVVPASVITSRQPVAPAAAQARQAPWARDFVKQEPGRGGPNTLIAPPVAAPNLPPRAADPRNVRPPPGVAARPGGDRPGFGRPGSGPDRPGDRPGDRRGEAGNERDGRGDGRGRDVARPETPRPAPGGAAQPGNPQAGNPQAGNPPPGPAQPGSPRPGVPSTGTPQPGTPAPVVTPPATGTPGGARPAIRPTPDNVERHDGTPPTAPRADDRRDDRRDDRGNDRGNDRRRGGDRRDVPPPPSAGAAPTPAPAANPAPAAAPRPAVSPAPEQPTMRSLPVQRNEDRRPRPEAATAGEARPPQRVERPNPPPAPAVQPAAPAPRPVEPARPPQAVAPAAPPPQVRQPEPPRQQPRNESPVTEQKRGEGREPRDQR